MTWRVAVTGFEHEANALAAVVTSEGVVDVSLAAEPLEDSWIAGPLIARLHELADVEIVALPVWVIGAGGPLDDRALEMVLEATTDSLDEAGRHEPIDAVVVLGHGAGRTTTDLDSDSTFLSVIRQGAGPETPIVVILDFHANLSEAMCRLADVIVGYRTNPHVDIADRLIEAADHVVRLLGGDRAEIVSCATPLVLPQIAQSTLPGETFAELTSEVFGHDEPWIWNLSVFGGFSLSDVPSCGVSICATVDPDHREDAVVLVEGFARFAVDLRERFRTRITSLDEAVRQAVLASSGEAAPVLLADVADNPGGGAPATSTFVLDALHRAGVDRAVLGIHCDSSAVDDAWKAGAGTSFDLVLNRRGDDPLAPRFTERAIVRGLSDRKLTPDRGVYTGAAIDAGRMAVVDVGGLTIVLSSRPVQCADQSAFDLFDLDLDVVPVVVVKSRGHFRAGFAHRFGSDRIIEVDAPGITPVDLAGIDWVNLPRPCFPLDEIDGWQPSAVVARKVAR